MPVLILTSLPCRAQHVEIAAHGGYGTTWLFNDNVSDKGKTNELSIASSYAHIYQGEFDYKSSHTATGHLLLGLSYRIGAAAVGGNKGK